MSIHCWRPPVDAWLRQVGAPVDGQMIRVIDFPPEEQSVRGFG